MKNATITLDAQARAPRIDPRIYGQYVEHLDDCVYPAIMRDNELREDVIEVVRDLEVPVVRWPGGCFADIYDWEDGIGPGASRPVRRNWHWGGLESNRFGTDEFLEWARRIGAAPYINVNLGTDTLTHALRWLDYCNGSDSTTDVEARRANGHPDPWDVPIWGIGNETWGEWEAGHTDPHDYGRQLANWADFFKRYESRLQIVGVGSSGANDPRWDEIVLDKAGEHIDFLSLHLYGASVDGREAEEATSTICAPVVFEQRIRRMAEVIDAYTDAHPGRRIRIAMDEWNIRHYRHDDNGYSLDRASDRIRTDALFAAGVFHAMIRNAQSIGMANYVFLVNGNAVVDARGERARHSWLSPVFRYYRQRLSGRALTLDVGAPTMQVPAVQLGAPGKMEQLDGSVQVIDAVASVDDDGEITLAILNRDPDDEVEVAIEGVPSAAIERLGITEPEVEAGGAVDGGRVTLRPHDLVFVVIPRR